MKFFNFYSFFNYQSSQGSFQGKIAKFIVYYNGENKLIQDQTIENMHFRTIRELISDDVMIQVNFLHVFKLKNKLNLLSVFLYRQLLTMAFFVDVYLNVTTFLCPLAELLLL